MSTEAYGNQNNSDSQLREFYDFLSKERLIELLIKSKHEINALNNIIRKLKNETLR